jgi:nucleotide-binding universal stress UspA family protein
MIGGSNVQRNERRQEEWAMLKGILVTIDGTPCSDAAVLLGMRWAEESNALLAGLGIIDYEALRGTESVPIGGGAFKQERDAALFENERQRIEGLLSQFALKCADRHVACKVLEDFGAAHEQVALEAQRFDIILIGQCEGHDSTRSPVISIARLVKDSPRPVVVVPKWPAPEGPIMVAYDGSLQAARTLQLFQASGIAARREVRVITMNIDSIRAKEQAAVAAEFLQMHGIHAAVQTVDADRSPAQTILDEAARLGAAMIVMGAYGQPALREFIVGSVTRTVLEHSRVPVFVYH